MATKVGEHDHQIKAHSSDHQPQPYAPVLEPHVPPEHRPCTRRQNAHARKQIAHTRRQPTHDDNVTRVSPAPQSDPRVPNANCEPHATRLGFFIDLCVPETFCMRSPRPNARARRAIRAVSATAHPNSSARPPDRANSATSAPYDHSPPSCPTSFKEQLAEGSIEVSGVPSARKASRS
ncbi:aggrecan core protein [Striga asiatica]|uniref:Aggrecan core protein n=1 Tax=Striga asiatica TaxID=4170 RepID=A0A5A7R1C2_STRAF|nr:aggrecan core protein [Striga asiatica]